MAKSAKTAATTKPPTLPKDNLPASANEQTVATMLDNLRRLVAYEEQRLNSLTTRGSGLAGFAGLATAVIAAGNDGAIPLASKLLLVAAAAGLLLAASGVVLKILPTHEGTIQSLAQLRFYKDPACREVKPARLEVQMIDILFDRLEMLRHQNRTRAVWLNRSARALVVGVFLAAAATVISYFA